VSSIADTQSLVRRAVVTGDATRVVPLLIGGRDAGKRLAIHRRHYETSLVTALLNPQAEGRPSARLDWRL
jgi:hypothetical protein